MDNQIFSNGNFSLVPIRSEDSHQIMKWRNEQIYHLRQSQPLTIEAQDYYFENVITKLFDQEQPDQILFSYLENNCCIGYGGLVRINWIDRNAEISFIMDTKLEEKSFKFHWTVFLELIEKMGFDSLMMHKLYVYAFDLRPHLYDALESNNYVNDAILKEHCFFKGEFINVVIYSKLN